MRRFLLASSAVLLSLTLVGCSAFYPNWGATGLPEEPEVTETSSPTEEPSQEPMESESTEPEPNEGPGEEPTQEPTEEPSVAAVQTQVDIIMAIAEPDYGVLTVVAQIPGISEAGGKCTLRFIGSDKEATMEVRAEPSSDYTQCFPIEFPLADLPSGNGIVTVSYQSDFHFGTSPASSVVIP
jgi:hypothetical protein